MSSSSPAIFAKPHLAPFPTRRSSDLGLGLDGKRGEDGERDAEEDEQPDATPRNRHDWKNPLERRACSRSHMSVDACCMANSLVCQANCTLPELTRPTTAG